MKLRLERGFPIFDGPKYQMFYIKESKDSIDTFFFAMLNL